MSNDRLKDKIAIVTGAATGIGAATACQFVDAGARVLATDIKDPGQELASKLDAHPGQLLFQHSDVCSESDWVAALKTCTQSLGVPNVLVNNAGMLGSGRPLHEETPGGMLRVFEVNVLGMMLGMRTVIPGMIAAGRGAIVNVSSVWGHSGVANNAAYQTTKGAAIMLSKNAGVTYAPHGIRVNCVLPGYVDTPMSRNVTEAEAKQLLAFTPLGRCAQPEELAPAIVFLASDEASFTAAGTFMVDGGMAAL
ncbi:SDR family NAD(P)-dependent oxidoreductase [Streptomyces sp. CA-106131]|uniref:SDR family NAD(P)-dependent oxidoreductase n=1 Tax=Streptomyces sp. CA-106131 TaxID=3240045 RepID=UPI003D94C900